MNFFILTTECLCTSPMSVEAIDLTESIVFDYSTEDAELSGHDINGRWQHISIYSDVDDFQEAKDWAKTHGIRLTIDKFDFDFETKGFKLISTETF